MMKLFGLRNLALKKFGIDLLSTDNSRKLLVSKILPEFNPRFKRNGADGLLNGHEVELKTSKTEKNDANFMFHVMGDIIHNQYLLAILDDMLNIRRHYIINQPKPIAATNDLLQKKKIQYLAEHGGKVAKRDIITITENEVIDILKANE